MKKRTLVLLTTLLVVKPKELMPGVLHLSQLMTTLVA